MSKTLAYPARLPLNPIEPISVTRYLADLRDCTFSLIRKEFIKKIDYAAMVLALQKFQCAKQAFFEAHYLQQLRLYCKFKKKHKHRRKNYDAFEQHIIVTDDAAAQLEKLLLDAHSAFKLYQHLSYNSTYNLISGLSLKYLTEQQIIDLLNQLNDYHLGKLEVFDLHPATQLSLHGIVRSKKASENVEHTREEIIQNIFPDFVTEINAACEQMCDSGDVLELPEQQQTFFRELASNQLVAKMLYCHMPSVNACLEDAQPSPCADAKKFTDIIHEFSSSDVKQGLIDRSALLLKSIVNNHAVYDFTQALELSQAAEIKNRESNNMNEIRSPLVMRV